MSQDGETKEPNGEAKAKRPSHIAYQVREGEEGKSYFNRVGAAFEHKDGEGYNVHLESMPVDGKVTLRTPKDRLQSLKNEKGGRAEREPEGAER